jgi:PEP-CTERM motif
VPEPGIVGLFGLGVAGLIVARRSSRRRNKID